MQKLVPWLVFASIVGLCAAKVRAQDELSAIYAELRPYAGPAAAEAIDRQTLTGKVMAGYQGWFTAEGDSAGLGWKHYGRRGEFRPSRCNIDLWPDVSELDDDETIDTPFRHADGTTAQVFSSHHPKTVQRHFQWMRDYGIDGVFVQRFVVETRSAATLRHFNQVLTNCREGANTHGRCYALMYDLSGLREGEMERAIEDWKQLVEHLRLGRDEADRAYLRHNGRPVVAVWGIGFNDGRSYTLADCQHFVDFLKDDPQYGGNTVMVGVPTAWRTLDRDAINDPTLHELIKKADIVSPWTVGRYDSPRGAARHASEVIAPDIAWCREHGKDYLPVAFPGFSWSNMRRDAPFDQIPRRRGEFLWSQFLGAKRAGADMLYVAMFDELDEGTAIFKCTNNPPTGESRFVNLDGLPSDHYLWLTGEAGKMLRGEVPATEELPKRAQ
jgi:hypothetical protein